MAHTREFKAAVIKKIIAGGKSQKKIAEEFGIGRSTLVKWLREYRNDNPVIQPKAEKRPKDWTAEERLAAVIATTDMADEELGAWCRRHGLHTHHIASWRRLAIAGCGGQGQAKNTSEKRRFQQEIKTLKRELVRKEKALAETAALLVLKKKVDAIWSAPEED